MIKLSTHEQKILNLIKENPEILTDPGARERIAKEHGMTEKTLRNRIGDLKRYGLVNEQGVKNEIDEYSDSNMQKNLFILWKEKKFVAKNIAIVAITSIIIAFVLPKWYSSEATILSSGAGNFNILSSISPIPIADFGLSSISEDINTFIAILNSRSIKEYMVRKFDLINRYDEKDLEYAMIAFEDKMELEITEEGTLKISVIDKNPELAKTMVEELLTKLDSVNQKLSMDKGRYNREFLEQRLNQTKIDLANAEVRLKEFQEETGIIDILTQIEAQYESYSQLYSQEMQAYTELFSLKAQTEVQLNVSKATLSPDNPTVKRFEVMLFEQEKQLDQVTSKLDKQLQEVILGLDENEQKNLSKNKLSKIPKMIEFKSFPELAMENARLLREVTIQNTLLELLLPQFETARLEESKNIPTLQVIDEPKVAINKVKPIRSLIVIASVIMGFLLSVVYIYIDYYSTDFRKQLKTI
ncbi:MAG: Wzz/FepE/Etk N-terminal domain-containing protein [Candidatus Marinimicrobia bacterium]|jgi:capsule polysaccharide export protein KpsE/RkpR|nr:hypothetical protein [Candidatus Neomarinimicrobiota bacterium]MDP6500789.1 Wzz/FepE/Etk N-terminal domain-containing protein [Candidatus Neomarinimicrobiota bacterium]MDP6725829.1 Wzz/FepE/Etk N-terminal domain-containing protein [Candidatus Neomarinimicrobiota bacterium]|tara:strand:- start:50489 stop:51901 length:1413 start_codon:yes stop_codon:yes gene_type:complete